MTGVADNVSTDWTIQSGCFWHNSIAPDTRLQKGYHGLFAWKFAAHTQKWNFCACRTRGSPTTGKFPRSTAIRDIHPVKFHTCTIIYPNHADKPKSFNIMRIYMFAILDKAKPDINLDLNMTVARHMTVEVIKLVLQPELPMTGHTLLYRTCTKSGLVYVMYIYGL
jgi:hypothetical protein